MSARMLKVRLAMAALFVILGLIIVARGVLQAAPLSFDLLGVLMILLGLVRLRDLRVMSDD